MLKNAVVLVDGGAGFIGSSMCKLLLENNAKVICFDNLSSGSLDNIKEFKSNANFVFVKGDVNNINDIAQVFSNCKIDFVLHYAAIVGVERTLSNPFAVLNDLEGIKNILALSRQHNVAKVVFSSSSEIYGDPIKLPEHEDISPLNTRLPYALIKGMGEAYFENYYKQYKLPTVCLRFFNVYGPKQNTTPYGFVTAIFIKQALNGQDLTVFGNGKQTRDFVYIDDNLNATLCVLTSTKCNGQTINIGTGKETQILELAKKIIKISGKNLKIQFCPSRKVGDMKRRRSDITKMQTLLGYSPKCTLTNGLESTYKWYENNKII